MRTLLLLALTITLAYGIWTLLGDDGEAPVAAPEELPAEAPTETQGGAPVPQTVTLVLIVRTAASTIPQGTVAGYTWGGDDRLRPVDKTGRVMFTDAPTGKVTLLARAPGYETVRQERYLTGGVPTDAILTLETRKQP